MLWQLFDHNTENAKQKMTKGTHKRPQQLEECTTTPHAWLSGHKQERLDKGQRLLSDLHSPMLPPQGNSSASDLVVPTSSPSCNICILTVMAVPKGSWSVTVTRDIREAQVEGRAMFIEATVSATASGRPRVAHG